MGPTLYGFFSQITGQARFGILSISALFLIGGLVLLRMKEVEARS
jgi:MFS transporter, UMF1 family